MAYVWVKTQYPGVRYREHPARKLRNGQPDKYFTIRYKKQKMLTEEALGWASEGWNPEKAHKVLADIKEAARTGAGPQSLAEKRALAAKEREAAKEAAKMEAVALMTLEVFFRDYYIPRIKKEKRSWPRDEQRIAKEINPTLGKIPLALVQREDIQRMLDKLAEIMAPATVKQYMAIVRRAFNIAMETILDGKPLFEGRNPAKGVRLPAVLNSRERFLTVQEADILIDAAKKLRSPDLHDCIILSLNTGLRLGELQRLEWLDVDLTHGIVTVREEEKRKPGGKVPLNNEAKTIFKKRQSLRGKGSLVFPPIWATDSRGISRAFRDLADAVGINEGIALNDRKRRVVFHTLRHTFASWLALGGTDIYRIKTLMRHKSIEMTMRYAHLIPDATREAVHNLRPKTPTEI